MNRSQLCTPGKCVPGRGNSKHNGPEAQSPHFRNTLKASLIGAESVSLGEGGLKSVGRLVPPRYGRSRSGILVFF